MAKQIDTDDENTESHTLRTATITIEGVSPYSQSKHHNEPKLGQETGDAHERRTWRHRMHITKDGNVFIPPMPIRLTPKGDVSER